jgi:hypothetical protein
LFFSFLLFPWLFYPAAADFKPALAGADLRSVPQPKANGQKPKAKHASAKSQKPKAKS